MSTTTPVGSVGRVDSVNVSPTGLKVGTVSGMIDKLVDVRNGREIPVLILTASVPSISDEKGVVLLEVEEPVDEVPTDESVLMKLRIVVVVVEILEDADVDEKTEVVVGLVVGDAMDKEDIDEVATVDLAVV